MGIVSQEQVLDGSRVRAGDVLIGLESSGLHTNGFTLARKIVFDVMKLAIDAPFPDSDRSVGDVLLEVHRSYLSALWPLLEDGRLGGLAHITGGGIVGNLPRILGAGLGAVVDTQSWEVPPVFRVLAEAGAIERSEMMRVFNMGVGLILVTSPEKADGVVAALGDGDTRGWIMGEVETGEGVRLA